MYDAGKIIGGLVIFLAIITAPIWYHAAMGKDTREDPELPVNKLDCVEEGDYMRAYHMDLLNTWRDEVVRNGNRVHEGLKGETFPMSLTNTCMDCHKSKKKFCDRCHEYAGVAPYCFDCHVTPKEEE